jgi:hypothetical protein
VVLPNDSHASATTGTTFATHTISGKEYPVGFTADAIGHIEGSMPAFGLVIPPSAVGASKIWFDLHTTTTPLRLRKLFAIVATDVAVTGVVSVRLDVMRTSSVGTGGTAAATTASASKTAPTIYPLDGTTAVPSGVTARAVSSGGAADEQWLFPAYVFTEETNVASHIHQYWNLVPEMPHDQPLMLPATKGLKVVQGTVAGVGSIGFLAFFTAEQ